MNVCTYKTILIQFPKNYSLWISLSSCSNAEEEWYKASLYNTWGTDLGKKLFVFHWALGSYGSVSDDYHLIIYYNLSNSTFDNLFELVELE